MAASEFKFLIKHSSIYGVCTILSQAVGFIMLPIYTRYLTPKDYGVLQLIEISTILIGMILTSGIAQTLSRFYFIPDDEAKRNETVSTMYLGYILISCLLLPVLFLISPTLAIKVLDSHHYTKYFYISFVSFILGGLLDVGLVYLRVINRSGHFTIISISRLIILLSLNIYFIVFRGLGVLGILYSTLITRVLFQFFLTLPILSRIKPKLSTRIAIDMLKFSLPLVPAKLGGMFVNQSDRYFIRYFVSISDTGIYSLAQKLGTSIHLLITCSFQSVFEPRRFEIVKRPDAKETFNNIFVYHSMVLVFAGLGLSLFIEEILRLMVAPAFYRAKFFVPIIVLSMVLFGFRNHFEFGILWSKKTINYAYVNGIMSGINLLLNLLLISKLGVWGAVYSELICVLIHDLLIYWFAVKYYFIPFDFIRVGKMILLAVSIYGMSLAFHIESLALALLVKSLLMILFCAMVFYFKIVKPNEAEVIKNFCTLSFQSFLKFCKVKSIRG